MNERSAESAQRAVAAAHRCAAADCPDEDDLIAFADGTLPADRRDQVAAQVAACARCAAVVRVALNSAAWADDLAADVRHATRSNIVERMPTRARPRPQAWLPFAIAATLVLFVGTGVLLRQAPSDDPLRGPTPLATTPVDGALLDQAPQQLAWPCAAAPTAAEVELLAADATVRWSGAATDCAATLPEQTRSTLSPGAYLWRVKDASGASVLGPVAFRIAQ